MLTRSTEATIHHSSVYFILVGRDHTLGVDSGSLDNLEFELSTHLD
jgi:hypothetical protein